MEDNGDLGEASDELRRASVALTARFRGHDTETPPPAPEPVEDEASETRRRMREHRDLLEAAAPWLRVTTRPWQPDLYQRLVDATGFALQIPAAPSFLSEGLFSTTRRAARVARNAAPDTFRELVTTAVTYQPLAVAALLLWQLQHVAKDGGHQDLADHAQTTLALLLNPDQWRQEDTWTSNRFHSRTVLDLTTHIHGAQPVQAVLTAALAAPELLDAILTGLVTWSENQNLFTGELTGFVATIRTLPEWIPVDALSSAILRQYPDLVPAVDIDLDVETDETRQLAAQALRAAGTPSSSV